MTWLARIFAFMLLQTNSYIVPKDKRSEHLRLLQRFRQTLARLGCEHFETYEQVGANWAGSETTGRFVQLMRFRDRRQQQAVQAAERSDPMAQALIREFCELINFPYQQQQGLFAVGFYQGTSATTGPLRQAPGLLGVNAIGAGDIASAEDGDQDLLAGSAVNEQFSTEFAGEETAPVEDELGTSVGDTIDSDGNGHDTLGETLGSADPLDPTHVTNDDTAEEEAVQEERRMRIHSERKPIADEARDEAPADGGEIESER